jgi:hypothetical protein
VGATKFSDFHEKQVCVKLYLGFMTCTLRVQRSLRSRF